MCPVGADEGRVLRGLCSPELVGTHPGEGGLVEGRGLGALELIGVDTGNLVLAWCGG